MIDLTRTQSEAVRDLKHYLEFAAQGPAALGAAVRSMATNDYDSDFEMSVAEGLRRLGWIVRTQIGVSKFRIDLGVIHPDMAGKFFAGIECDGATYHSSPSARDRDRVRHIILERLGWRLFRVWSTDWFIDPIARLQKLNDDLKALLQDDRQRATEREANAASAAAAIGQSGAFDLKDETPEEEEEFEVVSFESKLPVLSVKPPDLATSGRTARSVGTVENESQAALGVPTERVHAGIDPASFYEPHYRSNIRQLAVGYIAAEAPITYKRLTDLIAREHNFQRTGSQISSTIWEAVKNIDNHSKVSDGHTVYWPAGTHAVDLVPFRGLRIGARERLWKEVPLPERLGLVATLLDRNPPDLPRSVAEAIGYGRLTQTFRDEISELVKLLELRVPNSQPS